MELTPYIENHFRQLILLSYNPFFESLYTAPGSTLTQEQADGLKHQFVDSLIHSLRRQIKISQNVQEKIMPDMPTYIRKLEAKLKKGIAEEMWLRKSLRRQIRLLKIQKEKYNAEVNELNLTNEVE